MFPWRLLGINSCSYLVSRQAFRWGRVTKSTLLSVSGMFLHGFQEEIRLGRWLS